MATPIKSYTEEDALKALNDPSNRSISMVLRALGLCPTSGTHYTILKGIIERHGLKLPHLEGKQWRKGKSKPLTELLVKDGAKIASSKLRILLIKFGLKKAACEGDGCGISTWMGKPLQLQLHHVNGEPFDNRLENLQILCPNCHSQTPSYAVRKT